jgi:hypothetical protein
LWIKIFLHMRVSWNLNSFRVLEEILKCKKMFITIFEGIG